MLNLPLVVEAICTSLISPKRFGGISVIQEHKGILAHKLQTLYL